MVIVEKRRQDGVEGCWRGVGSYRLTFAEDPVFIPNGVSQECKLAQARF